jgi:hypothetical protein
MKKSVGIVLFVILAISACSPVIPTGQTVPAQTASPTPTLVRSDLTQEQSMLVSELSKKLGISANDIMVAETTAVTWPDDCMDINFMNSTCAKAEVPGFRFILVANGKQYEFHTNKDMTVIQLVENK